MIIVAFANWRKLLWENRGIDGSVDSDGNGNGDAQVDRGLMVMVK